MVNQFSKILFLFLALSLLTACTKGVTSAPDFNPDYMTEEDVNEQKTLDKLQATVKLGTPEKESWINLSLEEWEITLKYPKNFQAAKKETLDYLLWYTFQEKNKNSDQDPKINLQIISGDFEPNLKNTEDLMAVNAKQQITVSDVVGVKLEGVNSGEIVYLLPWQNNTLLLKNNSLNLVETFEGIVQNLVFIKN